MARLTPRDAALRIVHRLREHGHEALWAGGCVRDMLLGREAHDYDVATNARPERVIQLFRVTRKVGAQFGVVLVRQGQVWTEVATFRSDLSYEDGRHPTAVTFGSAEEDARRRDFTVNGMFYDPIAEQVVDFVGGQTDLEARVIRAIGEPGARFGEDHLRVLRAVRFAAKLGFEIDPGTRRAIPEHAHTIRAVSPERVREELILAFEDGGRARAFCFMNELGLLPHLWEGAAWTKEEIAACTIMMERLSEPVSFELAMAVLLHGREELHCGQVCRRLACSNLTRKKVCWLVQQSAELLRRPEPTLGELKVLMAEDGFEELMEMHRALLAARQEGPAANDQLRRRAAVIAPEAIRPAPLVTGTDLLDMGLKPGPIYSDALERLYMMQLEEEIRTRAEALEHLRGMVEEHRG
ncbi:MAG: CCA tRNA nucleotidyltransferase [Phycisphaerales bacterium]|nr:MAG: CCA tRNA nucleotidyltransferase [Phycisphaerales bacterium]